MLLILLLLQTKILFSLSGLFSSDYFRLEFVSPEKKLGGVLKLLLLMMVLNDAC